MGAVFLRWDGGALGFSMGFFQSLTRQVSGVLCGLGVCLASLVFLLAWPRSLFSPPLALAAAEYFGGFWSEVDSSVLVRDQSWDQRER